MADQPVEPVGAAASTAPRPSGRRAWHSRWLQVAISVGVVALIFGFLLPKLANYGEVWDTVESMTGLEIALLCGVALLNLVGYLPLLMAVLPGLRIREAAVSNFASTAISNTLPGGSALGVGVTVSIQRSFGIPPAEIALGAVISGIWNNFAKLGLPVLALGLLAATGEVGPGLTAAAIVGLIVLIVCIALFALLLRSARVAASVGRGAARVARPVMALLRRGPPRGWDDAAVRFRSDAIGLLRGRSWHITLATVLNNLLLYMVLLVALRVVGVAEADVGWIEALAAFAFVRLISAVPVTPGGLGVVELGLTAALGNGMSDSTQNRIAAAVLLYRGLTWFAPIPLGTISWLWWRANRRWRHTVEERRALLAPATHAD